MILAGRWIAFALVAGVGLLNLAIQFNDSTDRAEWKLVLMLASWSVVVYLGYRRARTVRGVRARHEADGVDQGHPVAAAAAGAAAVGATLAQAFAERASGAPVVVTLVWLGLGLVTGLFLFHAMHGDRTRVAIAVEDR